MDGTFSFFAGGARTKHGAAGFTRAEGDITLLRFCLPGTADGDGLPMIAKWSTRRVFLAEIYRLGLKFHRGVYLVYDSPMTLVRGATMALSRSVTSIPPPTAQVNHGAPDEEVLSRVPLLNKPHPDTFGVVVDFLHLHLVKHTAGTGTDTLFIIVHSVPIHLADTISPAPCHRHSEMTLGKGRRQRLGTSRQHHCWSSPFRKHCPGPRAN